MKVYVAAYLVVFAVLVLFLLNVLGVVRVLNMEGAGDPSAFAVPLAIFGVLMLLVIVAATSWRGAPASPLFWLVGAVPGLLFFLPDIPILIRALTSPTSIFEMVLALVVIASFVVLLAATAKSFLEARTASRSHGV